MGETRFKGDFTSLGAKHRLHFASLTSVASNFIKKGFPFFTEILYVFSGFFHALSAACCRPLLSMVVVPLRISSDTFTGL